MDFDKLVSRYNQFGGFRLIIEYAKLGALWPALKAGLRCVVKGQSFKQIYPAVLRRVEPFLVEKYGKQIQEIAQTIKSKADSPNDANKYIWFCWLQGIESAPEIVHACYNSLKRNIPEREIKVIDAQNWRDYFELPEYIVRKWEKGRIPAALFSDLLRLELLIKYGGTWIDSTVLCTGFNDNHNNNEKYLDADLFLFQYTKQGSFPVSISNWFITACSNNEVLIVLRDLLYAYWQDYDCTLDYYIFHLFFSMLSKVYPKEILAMPYAQSMNSLVIMHHLGDKFNQENWDRLIHRVVFHKLSYRVSTEIKEDKDNYYNTIITSYT